MPVWACTRGRCGDSDHGRSRCWSPAVGVLMIESVKAPHRHLSDRDGAPPYPSGAAQHGARHLEQQHSRSIRTLFAVVTVESEDRWRAVHAIMDAAQLDGRMPRPKGSDMGAVAAVSAGIPLNPVQNAWARSAHHNRYLCQCGRCGGRYRAADVEITGDSTDCLPDSGLH